MGFKIKIRPAEDTKKASGEERLVSFWELLLSLLLFVASIVLMRFWFPFCYRIGLSYSVVYGIIKPITVAFVLFMGYRAQARLNRFLAQKFRQLTSIEKKKR